MTYLFPAGAQRGTSVEVTASGSFERWPVRAWASGRGVTVKPAAARGKLNVTVAPDAVPGTYWLRLYDEQGASTARPFLVGTLPEVREQEPNDSKPQAVPAAVVVNGRLEKAGDVDGFAVSLRKGQTLVADLEANATLRSPMDAILQVVSPDGFVLDQNHDFTGLDPRVVFEAPRDGPYRVRVFAFPATPDSGIRFAGGDTFVYRLTLTAGGFADYPFPLAVSRPGPGEVEVAGWNLPAAARKLPVPAGDADEAVLFHPEVAGEVRVRREPHACVVKPPGGDQAAPFPLTLPVTVSGRLDRPQAADVYAFPAKKGQKLLFHLEARSLGLPLTARLRVADEAGQELAQAEPARLDADPELAFTAPQDGRYLLTVRDLHGDGGPRFVYRLRAVPTEPDFALTLKIDRLVLTPGEPLDIPVAVERRNGFAGDVELTVEGLPTGVEVGKAPAAGTVRLTAPADLTASAAIRIVGRAKGLTRTVTAPLPDFGQGTADVWLTVSRTAAKVAAPPMRRRR